MRETITLKVSSNSEANKIAGAMVAFSKENKNIELQAVGAGAVNQAVKAIALARGFMAPLGINLICIPAFTDIEIDGEGRTAMKFIVREEN